MAGPVRRSRYRIRPRLFVFAAVVAALLVYGFWPRPSRPVAVPPTPVSHPPTRTVAPFTPPPVAWYAGHVLPGPAQGLSATTAAGDLIAVGGFDGTSSSTAITAFGPAPLVVSLPVAVHDAAAVVMHATLYVLGGGTAVPTAAVQAVSLDGQSAGSPPPLPTPIADAAGVRTPDGFVLSGGYTGSTYLNSVSVWTPGRLTPRAHLPTGVRYAASAWYAGSLIVAGGLTPAGPTAHVYAVNLKTGRVTTWPSLPHPVYHAAMAVYRGDLLLVGGTVNGSPSGNTFVYDPHNRTWVAGPALPTPTADGALAVYNGQLWYLGGYNTGGPTSDVWIGKGS